MLNEQMLVEKIKSNYQNKPSEVSKLEQLKNLDKKVKTPALVFAYVFGILSTLVFGLGMCFALEVLGKLMILGIVVGVVGMILMCLTYPIYKSILKKRKKKYSSSIIALSDEILNNKEI